MEIRQEALEQNKPFADRLTLLLFRHFYSQEFTAA
jgi:hypothetical protein